MEDKVIAAQLLEACNSCLNRFRKAMQTTKGTNEDIEREVVVQFLSGANQAASFLTRGDGEITSQQLERALAIVGEKLGCKLTQG